MDLAAQLGVSQSDVISCAAADPVMMPASLENPNVDLNDPATYDLMTGGSETPSGVRVTEEKSLMHPAVWQAVTMISGDVASLPLELFEAKPDGDRVKLEQESLFDLVHWKPNSEMNAFRFWRRMMTWRLLWNNAYAFIKRSGDGSPRELVPLLPDRTAPERVDGTMVYVTEVDGRLAPLLPRDILHLEGVSIDTLSGYEFIRSARCAIGLGLAELGFASKFYKNGGRVGGILELPTAMSKPARDKVAEGFQRTYGSSEAFKTIVLRENAKFHAAQTSPEAAQVVDARKESVRDIARLFNVRPGKLGEESKTSFASKSEDNRDHHDTTLRPHLRDITQECRDKLLSEGQKRGGWYFRHDTRELLAMDFGSMSDALVKLRSGEIINSDEARRMLNLNKREDGKGGEYRNPNINTTDQGESPPADMVPAQVFRSLLASTVRRMARFVSTRARKLAANPSEFLAWIDDGYEGQRASISDAVGEIIAAAAEVIPVNADDETSAVVDAFMSESRQILQTIAGSTPEDRLRAVVEAHMTEWAAEAGDRYAGQVFGEPTTAKAA